MADENNQIVTPTAQPQANAPKMKILQTLRWKNPRRCRALYIVRQTGGRY